MTHKLERQLRGASGRYNGYILDNQQTDPTIEILHHVYCVELNKVFVLKRRIYDEIIKLIDQNRPNDKHRIEDAAFIVGDYIVFTFANDGHTDYILDFERSENPMNLVFANGRDVFVSQCVFNNQLNRVFTEHFGHFNVEPWKIRCHIGYRLKKSREIEPEIIRIVEIDADSHDFASKSGWTAVGRAHYDSDSDDDIDYEMKEIDKIDAVTGQKGIITGLTSVFVPDKPSSTILLPEHNMSKHYIGHETQCDLIYNEILKCYVVFTYQPRISTHYHTLLTRKQHDITGVFYVDIDLRDTIYGFYRHQQFKLIADPHGYLDMCRFLIKRSNETIPKYFTVPIRDRLGVVHENRSTSDLDIVTRFEIVGPGDSEEQLRAVEESAKRPTKLNHVKGVVINAKENKMFAYFKDTVESRAENFHGMNFYLPTNHEFLEGDHFVGKAIRKMDPDCTQPTLYMVQDDDFGGRRNADKICEYKGDGWFHLYATYREAENCYEAYTFGFIPCAKKPDKEKNPKHKDRRREIEQIFYIRAKENRNLPAQTILCKGEFIKRVG